MKNYPEIEDHVIGKLKRELPKDLYYHGYHHTLDVLRSAQMIGKAENLTDYEMYLLKVAVLYHDIGFTLTYKNHEEKGCDIAAKELKEFGFSDEEVLKIRGMIMSTKIPQSPKTKLEMVIADSDLEYLGTGNFESIGRTLFEEMKIYMNVEGEEHWNIIQMNFLKSHHYFTDYCKKHREAQKQEHLDRIIRIVESYG